MITNITLQNFKCFRELEVNPKLITVFIGPNGTGKSSVLQALLLLKQSVLADLYGRQMHLINIPGEEALAPNFIGERVTPQVKFEITEDAEIYSYSETYSHEPTITLRPLLPNQDPKISLALRELRTVPAVRGLVREKYRLGDTRPADIPLTEGLSEQEEQTASNLSYSRPIEGRLSSLLKTVTGTGLRTEPVPPQSVEVISLTPSGGVNMVWEGFGANALLLLLLHLLDAEKGATVLIEEPEIHLHPKAQAQLAEVLADTATSEDKQIIMTTHSEHVAGRLLTLVAENKLTTDDLAIYSFEKDEKGECSASEIEVTELGQTQGGLTGFFETDLAEMDRYVKALQKKS